MGGSLLTNTVLVASTTPDPFLANNTASARTAVLASTPPAPPAPIFGVVKGLSLSPSTTSNPVVDPTILDKVLLDNGGLVADVVRKGK
jgi:hypothetical protein